MTTSTSSGASGTAPWSEPPLERVRPRVAAVVPRTPAAASAAASGIERPCAETRSLSLFDFATLGAIALLVVLVSLPRIRRFALRENETDAIHALRVLVADADAATQAFASGDLAPARAASAARRARLEDVEALADGRLRRHGYLFAVVGRASGRRAIVAWPWEHGRTGLGAFAVESGGEPLGIANHDGVFSGPAHPPPAPSESDAERWRSTAGL